MNRIDRTLEDWEMGPDAMRWSAEPSPSPGGRQEHIDPVAAQWLGWSEVGVIFDELERREEPLTARIAHVQARYEGAYTEIFNCYGFDVRRFYGTDR